MPLSLNPFRKKTPDELNPYTVEIDLSDSFIKKVRRVSPTSAKFIFSCKNPFPCNVKFKTFQLDSLKSHFKNNLFKFKKFKVYADFEKEDIDWLMENRELLEKTSRNSKGGLGQSLKILSKKLRLNKIYKKIKKANQGFKYESRKGTSKISFAYGGRHEKKFVPLPRTVNLYCSTNFQQGYNLNIGNLRPMNSKDAAKKKENKLVFKSPELSKAIKKAIKFKVLGKSIKENRKYSEKSNHNFENKENLKESKPMKKIKLASLKEKIAKKMEARKLKLMEAREYDEIESFILEDNRGRELEVHINELERYLPNRRREIQSWEDEDKNAVVVDFLKSVKYDFDDDEYPNGIPSLISFQKFVEEWIAKNNIGLDDDSDSDNRNFNSRNSYDDDEDDNPDDSYADTIAHKGLMGLYKMDEKFSPEKCRKNIPLQESISRIIKNASEKKISRIRRHFRK